MMQSMGVTEFMHQLSFETFFGRLFRLEANIIHYNSALKAFEGNSWEAALALLEDLPQRMLEASLGKHMGVEPKIGVFTRPPEIIPFVHRIFHYFHHPFWVVFPLFSDWHPYVDQHIMNNIACFRSQAHFISNPCGSKNLLIQVSDIYSLGCFGSYESPMSIKQILHQVAKYSVSITKLRCFKIINSMFWKISIGPCNMKLILLQHVPFAFLNFLFGFVGGCSFLLEYHGCAFGCGLMVPYSATITHDDSERLGKACVGTSAWFLVCGHDEMQRHQVMMKFSSWSTVASNESWDAGQRLKKYMTILSRSSGGVVGVAWWGRLSRLTDPPTPEHMVRQVVS